MRDLIAPRYASVPSTHSACAVTAFKRELEKSFSLRDRGSDAEIARELRNA